MSQLAVDGYRAERAAILDLAHSLTPEQWMLPSGCEGWTVRDVIGHMACAIHGVVDPAFLPDMTNGTEQAMEPGVAERRGLPIEDVVAEYETYSEQAASLFESLQAPPMADSPLAMGELGMHPLSILPSTFLFDGYTHLRVDILGANPSLATAPPRDEQRLRPTLEWMLAGLPWMCPTLTEIVDRPLVLAFDGPGGGTWTIGPADADGRVTVTEGDDPSAAARVSGTDHDFVVWGTQRAPWRDHVKVEGDEAYAARVLDAINII